MQEEAFRDLLTEHLVPMLAGTALGKTRPAKSTHALVAYEHPCALLMKPVKTARYRVELVRSQAFLPEEKRLVTLFVEGFAGVAGQEQTPYFRDLMAALPRRAISQFLPASRGRAALAEAIEGFVLPAV
ncbi:MAG: hypothetical protein HY699_18105 [Deltaproteobacteria bacterium]|nr:hypothetical protein [Deltaproteobacteria bacterium]